MGAVDSILYPIHNFDEVEQKFLQRFDVSMRFFLNSYYYVKYILRRLAFSFDSFSIISHNIHTITCPFMVGPPDCQPNFLRIYENEKESTTKWGETSWHCSQWKDFADDVVVVVVGYLDRIERKMLLFVCVPHDSFSVLCFYSFFFILMCVYDVTIFVRDGARTLSLSYS